MLLTTICTVTGFLGLGLLARYLRTLCEVWLLPDSEKYRQRIQRWRQRDAERIAFYTVAARPPQKGA